VLVVGVDACKTGWIAVVLRDGTAPHAHFLPVIDSLESVAPDADAVAIDIPIGLPHRAVGRPTLWLGSSSVAGGIRSS
jgi:predicted RNase H-like nuclease